MLKYFLCAIALASSSFCFANSNNPLGFESPEHILIGNNVSPQFPNTAPPKLHLANGLALTYGEILTLGGDFYGVIEEPIALGKTATEQKQRFLKAYATLAIDANATSEAPKLLAVMQETLKHTQNANQTMLKQFSSADYTMQWNCITGGMCPSANLPVETVRKIYFLQQGRYLKLADTDFDHFSYSAWTAYAAGHAIALETALQAHQNNNIHDLETAYAINAFASHYLSDAFSPGHMRTPRLELYNLVFPATIGSLLSGYMHGEENHQGLIISNRRGDTWQAYGDGFYLDPRNERNREILQEALQASADDVYTVFITGRLPTDDVVFKLIPNFDTILIDEKHLNTPALFVWDKQKNKLLRRVHMNDLQDTQLTEYWLGWETLLELVASRGLPAESQAALLTHEDTRKIALQKGLITDKDILQFYQSQLQNKQNNK